METKEMTCICCPMGCRLTAVKNGEEITVTGFTCKRGEQYGIQEMRCPMRTVTTSIRVEGGVRPVCSVKTATTVPKASIEDVLSVVKTLTVKAPIHIGDVLVENIAGTGAKLVATAND